MTDFLKKFLTDTLSDKFEMQETRMQMLSQAINRAMPYSRSQL